MNRGISVFLYRDEIHVTLRAVRQRMEDIEQASRDEYSTLHDECSRLARVIHEMEQASAWLEEA